MTKRIHVVGAAIFDASGRCLIARRSATMSLPLMWEFPGGKIEEGEEPREALEREILEELALEIRAEAFIARGVVSAGEREIVLDIYRATRTGGELALREHAEAAWVFPSEFADFDFAEADLPAVALLSARGME